LIGTTLGYEGLGSLVLFHIGEQPPDRDEWRKYVDFLKERVAAHGKIRLVVVAGSGAPDALQRKQVTEAFKPTQVRAAVVSDSIVSRGLVTAFRWYGLDLDAFKSSEIDAAYRFVGVNAQELDWLQRTLAAFRAAVDPRRAASR
jgi:hypothetical protein